MVGLGLALDVEACIGVESSLFLLEYTCSSRGVFSEGSFDVIPSESFGIVDGVEKDDR